MKTFFYLFIFGFLLTNCQQNKVIKTHGISYLEKRANLLNLNKSNKNDVIEIFGPPSTKGMTDDKLWIYIERTLSRKSLLKLGKNYLSRNNVLVLEFNKYGILKKKDLYNKDDMKDLEIAKEVTDNEIRRENFIYSFLSSIRQKMESKRK